MNTVPKGAHSMRIIALPLARLKVSRDSKLKPSDLDVNSLLVFYHFDLLSQCSRHKDFPLHKKVLKRVMNRAADLWASLGKAPRGSWKLWTYELGERIADQVDFEELALRDVDPSLGPTTPLTRTSIQVNNSRKDNSELHSFPKISLIYPPSLYSSRTDHALRAPLTHLQTLLASREPQHRRGFFLWMLIAPLTAPITLIPIIPNLPFFFCVWRSWSHYRAYRSSRYLSALLASGLIEPNPSLELDKLYVSIMSFSRIPQNLPPCSPATRSLQKSSTFGNAAPDRKPEAASGTEAPQSQRVLLTREAMPQILEMFRLPEPTMINMCRAVDQARARLEKSS